MAKINWTKPLEVRLLNHNEWKEVLLWNKVGGLYSFVAKDHTGLLSHFVKSEDEISTQVRNHVNKITMYRTSYYINRETTGGIPRVITRTDPTRFSINDILTITRDQITFIEENTPVEIEVSL